MLADSNILIYAIRPDGRKLLRFIIERLPAVSAITYDEVLGTTRLPPADMDRMRRLFERLTVFPIDQLVLDQAVALRQQRKMFLGDALIAATALVYRRKLITRNMADFAWIAGLALLDPYAE